MFITFCHVRDWKSDQAWNVIYLYQFLICPVNICNWMPVVQWATGCIYIAGWPDAPWAIESCSVIYTQKPGIYNWQSCSQSRMATQPLSSPSWHKPKFPSTCLQPYHVQRLFACTVSEEDLSIIYDRSLGQVHLQGGLVQGFGHRCTPPHSDTVHAI